MRYEMPHHPALTQHMATRMMQDISFGCFLTSPRASIDYDDRSSESPSSLRTGSRLDFPFKNVSEVRALIICYRFRHLMVGSLREQTYKFWYSVCLLQVRVSVFPCARVSVGASLQSCVWVSMGAHLYVPVCVQLPRRTGVGACRLYLLFRAF